MAENFERHKSTRWVKADVPSYGDQWGNEYDYGYEDKGTPPLPALSESSHPETTNTSAFENSQPTAADSDSLPKSPAQAAPLVLSIDSKHFDDEDDDDDDDDDDISTVEEHGPTSYSDRSYDVGLSYDLKDNLVQPRKASTRRPPPVITNGLKDDSDFFPPTPTFSMHQYVPRSPETPQSDRSYNSDADSIQREPDNLHLAYQKEALHEIEETQVDESLIEATNPPDLILSIDGMNLDSSDDSSDNDRYSYPLDTHYSHDDVPRNYSDDSVHESIDAISGLQPHKESQDTDLANDDDDWGYNSQHSSNEEILTSPIHAPTEPVVLRQPIKTDALDSLINDLLQMERHTQLSTMKSIKSDVNESEDELPSLDPIHDLSLDFENHTFAESVRLEPISEEVQKEHELYVSSLLGRNVSVRKLPPALVSDQLESFHIDEMKHEDVNSSKERDSETHDLELEPVISSGSISTGKESLDVASVSNNTPNISRRVSTVSNATFNMGAWKPNTNSFRDQFVNDNDNESQMNFSVYNADENNYAKFTGLRPASGYAESFANSSCLSVPETLDAALPSIDEHGSENGDLPEESTTTIGESSELFTMESGADVPSVLQDHNYVQPKFGEERVTPAGSTDQLENEKILHLRNVSDVSASTDATRIVSEPSLPLSSASKLPKQKYPTYSWKQIMSVSQPIDRIHLLQKARVEEEEYETGLTMWLHETLKSAEVSSNIHIGRIATEAYQNAQHSDLRRHTSIRSKVSLVKDKMDPGSFGLQASSIGRRFLSRGKKLMKSGSD